MLQFLSIRNVVLIDKLELNFASGLTVLTGETGAGKSILLDALSLAMGERANSALIRVGEEQATVTAEFKISSSSKIHEILKEHAIPCEDNLVLRRILTKDGKSKAFLNDQLIGLNLLKEVGSSLIEIHGQFDQLLDPAVHLEFLDQFGGLLDDIGKTRLLYENLKEKEHALQAARTLQQDHLKNVEFIRYAVEELEALAPEIEEEQKLNDERDFLVNRAKIMEAVGKAFEFISHEQGVEAGLGNAKRLLDRVEGLTAGKIKDLLESFERAVAEVSEISHTLSSLMEEDDESIQKLEKIEERLYQLRSIARKHNVSVNDLPALFEDMKQKLSLAEGGEEGLEKLESDFQEAQVTYLKQAKQLSQLRFKTAEKLDQLVNNELAPLKLEKAKFKTSVEQLSSENAGFKGIDRVEFLVQTNPGHPFGGLAKIASGGERSRFMLALKVALARTNYVSTLIFDEIDSGVGGAVAAALGERLSKLAKTLQVLTITHSPQVASYASHHFVVSKTSSQGTTSTDVRTLSEKEREEEIARLLAGQSVTDEARAAAKKLLAVGGC
jgi:DNA repair protein RecN (Recombination protein N)